MIFRQLFDRATCTYTYLLGDRASGEALIIDPVRELADRDAQIVEDLGLKLVACAETHVHADHITGAWRLKARTGCQIVYPSAGGVPRADRLIGHGEVMRIGDVAIEARATPGHTAGCTSFVAHDAGMVFTGDALFVRGCGRTDFQGGDAATLYRSVWEQVLSLPDATEVRPGHDYNGLTASTVGEEKILNPRLGGGRSVEEFVAIMDGLDLAYPERIKEALPGNRALGRGEDDLAIPWSLAGLDRSKLGARQVSPQWVRDRIHALRLVDVREPRETAEGHLAEARLVPLGGLVEAVSGWTREQPTVAICRAGARSDQAALVMERLGFPQVASMTGGMLGWNA